MQPRMNRQWILRARPADRIDSSLFELRETPVPELGDDQVLAQTLYLSFDPTQRIWMAMDSYIPKVPLGEPMRAGGIAQVIESRHPKYRPGELISYLCGWQEYVLLDPDSPERFPPVKVPGHLDPVLTLALSLTGLTAYFGLLDIGKPKAGETVLVSGAAGATGSIAAQIARLRGCRVIGIAGGPEKCAWLTETARLDAAIDYKNESIGERLDVLCPDGVDVYFDNVGGAMLDEVLLRLALHARIVLCGAISQYERPDAPYGLKHYLSLIINRGTAHGFIILDYFDRAAEGLLCLNRWVEQGKLVQEIDMQEGFEHIPATLTRLFTGANLGKQLLRVSEAPLPVRSSPIERMGFGLLSAYMGWRKRQRPRRLHSRT
ncbi:MAG: NADP-dependent oxidoreductase [Gemmatimonadota bacterium]|nr:MAG: NADP-dependent oxidoreductase [Gemmatimonadota bacterium]